MGRRLNTSKTTVIQTELRPLTDNFELIPSGQTEQWYHVNTNVFKPDRQLTPLTITPKVSAFDEETGTSYAPVFNTPPAWYANEWNGTEYVETRINNQVDDLEYDYVITSAGLRVHKNISDATHGVTIRCVGQYIDPRDAGIAYEVEQTIMLTANRDAEVVYPKIDVLAPSAQMFNPLVDNHIDPNTNKLVFDSVFSLKAVADWTGVPKSSEFLLDYSVDPLGMEAIIPDNESALVTSAPTMDIRYGKGTGSVLKENQQFMFRQVSGGTVSPIGSNLAYIEKVKGNTVKWNQLVNTSTTSVTLQSSHEYYTSISGTKSIVTGAGSAVNVTGGSDIVVDLTEIFGAGNEPSTVADFEAWLAQNIGLKSYYPYNAGELIPVKMSAIKSVGFNIWDEQWEIGDIGASDGQNTTTSNSIRSKNYIPVLRETVYYFKYGGRYSLKMRYYDSNKKYLGYTDYDGQQNADNNTTRKTPTDCCYVRFAIGQETSYNNDICINLSDPSRNGTYEAHWEAEQYLPVTQLKGKASGSSDSVVIFPNGMNKVGNVYDEIKVENEVVKAVKRCDIDNGEVVALQSAVTYTIDNMPRGLFEWYGVKNGTEVKIDTLPCYVSGQHTDTLVVDAMYDDNLSIILKLKETAAATLPMPMKVYKNIVWRIPPINSIIMSKNGGAVRSESGDFEFTTIVNSQKTIVSEESIKANLRFKWRTHRTNTAAVVDKGWGFNMTATKEELINVRGVGGTLSSTNVDNDVYLLGAYEAVTYNNEELTYNGAPLYGRSID